MTLTARIAGVSLAGLLLQSSAAAAQETAPFRHTEAGAAHAPAAPAARADHHFWDATNLMLIGGVTASRALDFTSTGHFRALGDREWLLTNKIVDDKPVFAAIEVAAVAASVGVSYLLHRAHHHRLERWVSVLHIGITAGGAIHNYSLTRPAVRTAGAR